MDFTCRVNMVVVDQGCVDLDVPPTCTAAQPILPDFYLNKQNQADNGKSKIQVNLTKVGD